MVSTLRSDYLPGRVGTVVETPRQAVYRSTKVKLPPRHGSL